MLPIDSCQDLTAIHIGSSKSCYENMIAYGPGILVVKCLISPMPLVYHIYMHC